MKKLFCLIILLGGMLIYTFIGTSPEAVHSAITFPMTEELQGRVVPLDSVMFRYPYRLEAHRDRRFTWA